MPYRSAAPRARAADGQPYGGQGSRRPFDPLRPRRSRRKQIAEILGLARHLAVEKLHDAHGIGWPPIIGQDIFGDPEITRADDPPNREAFLVRLRGARRLDLPPPADALARLRIFEHRVLSVNLMLPLEVVRIGSGPVAIQRRADLSLVHVRPP